MQFGAFFLGYGLHKKKKKKKKKGYRCYNPTANRTYITTDVTFLESKSFFQTRMTNSALQGEPMGEEPNWLITPRGEMTLGIEIENEELQPLMNMAEWEML